MQAVTLVRAAMVGVVCLVLGMFASRGWGQTCGPGWLLNTSPSDTGPNADLFAVRMWDPDGTGPRTSMVVVGGQTDTGTMAQFGGIASWDGAHWQALGAGVSGNPFDPTLPSVVLALATANNGDLLAGGVFVTAGGVTANGIARWNGSSWSALGGGVAGNSGVFVDDHYQGAGIRAIAVMPNGDVIVGGSFAAAGAVSASNIARWNGTGWSSLGSGVNGPVEALIVLPNGNIVAGGDFTTAGGATARHIARWNGTSWSEFGGGVNGDTRDGPVYSLAIRANGDVIAAGYFTMAAGVLLDTPRIAGWNGTSWYSFGSGTINDEIDSVAVLPNGDVVIGGDFGIVGGISMNRIARWDTATSTWNMLADGVNPGEEAVWAMTVTSQGDLIAAGGFSRSVNLPTAGGRCEYISVGSPRTVRG